MDKNSTWVELKLNECRLKESYLPESIEITERLLTACVSLKKKNGFVFGMIYPKSDLDPTLYKIACSILGEHMSAIQNHNLRNTFIKEILSNHLDIPVTTPDETQIKCPPPVIDLNNSTGHKGKLGDIVRVINKLKKSGANFVNCQISDVPSDETLKKTYSSLPTNLQNFLREIPSAIEVDWFDEKSDISGTIFFDLSNIPSIQKSYADEVNEFLVGLEHYYLVWTLCVPFMETPNSSGYIAYHEDGSVRFLDKTGDVEINGLILATSLEEFWRKWSDLGFITIDPMNIFELFGKTEVNETRLGIKIRNYLNNIKNI